MNKRLLIVFIVILFAQNAFSERAFVTNGKNKIYIGMTIGEVEKLFGSPRDSKIIRKDAKISTIRINYDSIEIEYQDRDNLPFFKGNIVNLIRIKDGTFSDQFGNKIGRPVTLPVKFDYKRVKAFVITYYRDDEKQFIDWRPQ